MNYSKYKPKLRIEFEYTCGYCKIREPELGGSRIGFEIDHYRPKSKFPHLINSYGNLIYACRSCNRYKRDYWPKPFQSKILNPREDNIEMHIDTSRFSWHGKTGRGRKTVELLQLDSVALVQRRRDRAILEETISELENIREEHNHLLSLSIENRAEESIDQNTESIRRLTEKIEALKRTIHGPME